MVHTGLGGRRFEAEAETVLGESIVKIADMYERMRAMELTLALIPEIKLMIGTVSAAQATMAQSAQSMADTFRRAEDRYQRMEERYEELAKLATGKEQIPLKSHYWSLIAALLPTVVIALLVVIAVLYYTKQELKVSLKEFELKQQKTNELVLGNRESAIEAVDQAVKDIKENADGNH